MKKNLNQYATLSVKKYVKDVLCIGLHTVNMKRYGTGTGTGKTVPVVSVSLTVKRYL